MSRSLSNAYEGENVILKNESGLKKAWITKIKISGGKKSIFVTHKKGVDAYGCPVLQTDEWRIPYTRPEEKIKEAQ